MTPQEHMERGAWFAFDHVLGWINTQSSQMIDKKDLYRAVMQMRPSAISALIYGGGGSE
jgi:hypothetical protein